MIMNTSVVAMNSVFRTRASAVWFVLVALTVVSWALGTSHGVAGNHELASLVIIVVAAFKIRFIGLYFMELRDAPWALRGAFEGYCALLPILLGAFYLFV